MRFLYQFLIFQWIIFKVGKVFKVVAIREWLDFDSKEKLGWCVDTVIVEDNTPYKLKEGQSGSNLYEKLTFKVESPARPQVNIGDSVEPVGEPVCTVYGEYKNLLSVRCSGVQVVPATTATTKKEND